MFGKKKVGFRQISEKELQDVTSHVAEKEILSLKEQVSSKNQEIEALYEELEQFYLKAVENCVTFDEMEAVLKRYHESGTYKSFAKKEAEMTRMEFFCTGHQRVWEGSQVDKAASAKTKELKKEWVLEICGELNDLSIGEDDAVYADRMMAVLKDVAHIEADGKKILDAWKSGLDAWQVFLSMLSVYNVKQSDVLGAE